MLLAVDQALRITALDQDCPIEFSVMMEMFYTSAVQYGNHWPCMITEHLKCG